jgi:uncharacterized cupredoxin-like copper-binding protein
MHRIRIAAMIGVVVTLLAACGSDDDSSTAGNENGDARTVEVDMVDIAFEPDTLEIARGETVRFVFTNTGEVAHDAFIGDQDDQAGHEAEMREADDDEGHGGGHGDDDAENAVTVEPGDTGELTYTFDEAGTLEVGCHQPGHYDAGMTIAVEVA